MLVPAYRPGVPLVALACALLAVGCAPSPTQLVVVVDTDLQIPAQLGEVVVTVSMDGRVVESERESLTSSAALPLTVGVSPSGDSLGPIDVVAHGARGSTVVVERRARVTLVRGETRMLRLDLLARCAGESCRPGESCGESGCEPVEIEDLPAWPGTPPRLGDDAGAPDAGPRDASADAMRPDAAPVTCDDASDCDDGFACTTDTCSSEGLCVHVPSDSACDDGEQCTADRCEVGVGCVTSPVDRTCDDGIFCNGADRCAGGACSMHNGDPCDAPTVCDEAADRCSGCRGDSDCPADSVGDWGACAFDDVCDQSGARSRNVRSYACESGACVPTDQTQTEICARDTSGVACGAPSCGTYRACEYASVCAEAGQQSRTCTTYACNGGTCRGSMQTETSPCERDTDGSSCGSSRQCRTGTCVSCAPTLSGTYGMVGSSFVTSVTGSGVSLTFRDGTNTGTITASTPTFSGAFTTPICVWRVMGMGDRIRFVDWNGTESFDVLVSGASVSGTSAPPCIPSEYGCFPPCVARVEGAGSALRFEHTDGSVGMLTFGCL